MPIVGALCPCLVRWSLLNRPVSPACDDFGGCLSHVAAHVVHARVNIGTCSKNMWNLRECVALFGVDGTYIRDMGWQLSDSCFIVIILCSTMLSAAQPGFEENTAHVTHNIDTIIAVGENTDDSATKKRTRLWSTPIIASMNCTQLAITTCTGKRGLQQHIVKHISVQHSNTLRPQQLTMVWAEVCTPITHPGPIRCPCAAKARAARTVLAHSTRPGHRQRQAAEPTAGGSVSYHIRAGANARFVGHFRPARLS